jgi:hypothetical protein
LKLVTVIVLISFKTIVGCSFLQFISTIFQKVYISFTNHTPILLISHQASTNHTPVLLISHQASTNHTPVLLISHQASTNHTPVLLISHQESTNHTPLGLTLISHHNSTNHTPSCSFQTDDLLTLIFTIERRVLRTTKPTFKEMLLDAKLRLFSLTSC